MGSKRYREILDKMDRDSWYVKLKRKIWFKLYCWRCLSRKFWDNSYSGYIFKKSNSMEEIIATQKELIDLLYSQVIDLSMMSKIELGDDVIAEINRLKSKL